MRINQQKIAQELQLSPATVSRSLRGSQEINVETRARVLEAARKMGYKFPLTPLNPETDGEFKTLGVLIYGTASDGNFVPQHFLEGMSEAAHRAQASLMVHYVSTQARERLNEPEFQPVALRSGQLDGLLFIRSFPKHIIQNFANLLPCVTLTHHDPSLPIDCADIDHVQGIGHLVEHLYSLGHRRLGFCGDIGNHSWNQARFAGFLQSLVRLELPYEPQWCLNVGSEKLNPEQETERVLQSLQAGITAWVCANDLVGYQLMKSLAERGVQVPGQVSITGFDGILPMYGCPQITCMRPQFEEIGASAVRRMLERLREPNLPPQHILLGSSLLAGSSTAAVE